MASINTNLLSLTGQANLKRSQSALATSMERLSSGLRINGAKDDAAGQAITNRMTSQISGSAMAMRNANDGVSMTQTAHGALDQINGKLQRIRELSVQGLNGSLTLRDTDTIQAEINMNLREIDRLAATVDYNGIPLLIGQAGTVNLQVGANDRETLGIDLNPPGFSVEALGLKDFTIAGIEGEVTPRDTLYGRAWDIELAPPTQTRFLDVDAEDPRLMHSDDLAQNYRYGYYISAQEEGEPVFYWATYSALHETASDTSRVDITSTGHPYDANATGSRRIFIEVEQIGGQDTTAIRLTDSNGDPLTDGLARTLKEEPDGTYLIEELGADSVVRHYQAGLAFSEGSNELEVRQGALRTDPSPTLTERSSGNLTFGGDSHVLDGAGFQFRDANGNELSDARLVESEEGDLFIQANISGETVYYRLGQATESTEDVEGTEARTLTFTAGSGPAYLDPILAAGTDPVSQTSIPEVDISAHTDLVELLDDQGGPMAGATRLMQRQDGQYVIEVEEAAGIYRYFNATISVTTDNGGEPIAIIAQAASNAAMTFDTHNDELLKVSGTSIVTIDPDNTTIEVNYTDSNGDVHADVLRKSGDGNYYFDLPSSHSSYGNFKIASLVDVEGNGIMIKTINGNGEVIIYHPTENLVTGVNYAVDVVTDVDGFDNAGMPKTVINIVESPQELRLKTPSNPLAALDRAISFVDSKRSHLGAMENRLASVIEGHQSTNINLSAARSRILDADYAVEVANMTRAQILQQAGTSVLAQANQIPQNVLSLLG